MESPIIPDFSRLDVFSAELLSLLALIPEGIRADELERFCGVAKLSAGSAKTVTGAIQRGLEALGAKAGHDSVNGFQLHNRAVRRAGLNWLLQRGTASHWAARCNAELLGQLKGPHHWYSDPKPLHLGVRLAICGGSGIDAINAAFGASQHLRVDPHAAGRRMLVEPLDDFQLEILHPSIRFGVCLRILSDQLREPGDAAPLCFRHAMACAGAQGAEPDSQNVLAHHQILQLDLAENGPLPASSRHDWLELAREVLNAELKDAIVWLRAARASQLGSGRKRAPLPGLLGLLHALAEAAGAGAFGPDPSASKNERLESGSGLAGHAPNLIADFQNKLSDALPWTPMLHHQPPVLEGWSVLLLCRWAGLELPASLRDWAVKTLPVLEHCGWLWLVGHVRAALDPAAVQPAGIWRWRQVEAPWQRALRAIERFARPPQAQAAPAHSRLVAKLIRSYQADLIQIEVRELRPTAKGGWTSGRLVDSRNADEVMTRLDPQDLKSREVLVALNHHDHYDRHIELHSPLIDALVGHPHLSSDTDQPLSFQRRAARIRIQRSNNGMLRVALEPPANRFDGTRQIEWTADKLLLTDFDPDMLRLAAALGRNSAAEFPEAAVPQLAALAPHLSQRIEVEADLGSASLVDDLDPRIHVLIEAMNAGLRMRLRTRPMGQDGVSFVPGCGPVEVLGLRQGAAVRGVRTLSAEHAAMASLLQQVPLLAGGETGEAVELEDPEQALETLSALQELEPEVLLDWSMQKRWSLTRKYSFKQLSVSVQERRDWFHAEAGLKLDDGQVISLSMLLEALASSQGRFVRLADERIVALSQELARQLRQIRALADSRGRLELAPVGVAALQPFLEQGASLDLDQAFRDQLERIRAAEDSVPELPGNLQAELRDYQIEGVRWLLRLASWGAGACLADDMGLGKTLQALAVLLDRASLGPALVVAPTSVVPNWRNEARRFAPTLDVRVYGEGDRVQLLESLEAGQVVLISYGLLTLNIEAFSAKRFATLVLDEAQAIKNAAAQRSQAIRALQADFRMATTGTPIENHLGELWSLMRVLNPGLLGSQEQFGKRFMGPIERDPRGPERETLRRLISPFLLRRLKSQVLAELPPRTEIVLTIEPSVAEARLLAALRKQAIERIATGELPDEEKRFHVLAELTRLRRAACHPDLVAPELKIRSSKLEQLLELVIELKQNRHRALIFSQFVDYLAIVRSALIEAGISMQYLDGSTPSKAREAAISAFQNGQGDVFLLSLKAGGVGLNLTAADYVIHLDPWWNPAVEQQATDRAHRIGQLRPVTVYKLVVQGSIEQQILELHGNKRLLADSVLADQDGSARLGVGELLGLLGG